MREDLSFELIKRGFSRRERVTQSYEIDLHVTVGRLKDGRIAISERNVTHGVGEGMIALTDEQARIIAAELTRALDAPSNAEASS